MNTTNGTREGLIKLMQERAAELGRDPKVNDFKGVRGTKWPSFLTFVREFGSFDAAKEAAGFVPQGRGRPKVGSQ